MVSSNIDGFGDPSSLSMKEGKLSKSVLEQKLVEPSDQVLYLPRMAANVLLQRNLFPM
jgi:hypothetical protein